MLEAERIDHLRDSKMDPNSLQGWLYFSKDGIYVIFSAKSVKVVNRIEDHLCIV